MDHLGGCPLLTCWELFGLITDKGTSNKSRLPLTQVELLHMEASPGLNERAYVVKGRLRNHSEELTINMIVLQATLQDCIAKSCQVVGQEERRIFVRVPPIQSRDFDVNIPFSTAVAVRGTPEWQFVILEVETKE